MKTDGSRDADLKLKARQIGPAGVVNAIVKSPSIVWSLDPFDQRVGDRLIRQLIHLWTGNSAANVFPVSVLASYQLG